MSTIYIKDLHLKNFRLYKSCDIPFTSDGLYKMNAFVADNGNGKTTLLYAINWCLYGKEELNTERRGKLDKYNTDKLPIINSKVLEDLANGQSTAVEVSFTVVDETRTVEFSRIQTFMKIGSAFKTFNSDFKVTITPDNPLENTTVYTDDADTKPYVEQFFSSRISNFYFFDGERLQDFFKSNTNVRQAIFNICQIDLLQTAIDRCKNTNRTISAKILTRQRPDKESLVIEQKRLEDEINAYGKNSEDFTNSLHEEEARLRVLDEIINGYAPLTTLQNEAARLDRQIALNQSKQNKFAEDLKEFICQYSILLPLYPDIKKAYTIIKKKKANNELPPPVDTSLLEEALANLKCPVCCTHLDQEGIDRVKGMLKTISVSSRTSNTLSKMESPLEYYLQEIRKFPDKKESLLQQREELLNEADTLEKNYESVNLRISQLISDSKEEDLKKAQEEYQIRKSHANELRGSIATAEVTKKYKLDRLSKVNEELETIKNQLEVYDKTAEESRVLTRLQERFTQVHDDIMKEMKDNLSNRTWEYFKRMSPKVRTFGHIYIDESYDITAFDTHNNKMTFSMSETEFMTLAYAFTLAIHETSGKNCPLVIDSPLGRAAGLNRTQIAKTLLDNSRYKQIIILFNPNELYGEVEEIFKQYQIGVTRLKISDDETHTDLIPNGDV